MQEAAEHPRVGTEIDAYEYSGTMPLLEFLDHPDSAELLHDGASLQVCCCKLPARH